MLSVAIVQRLGFLSPRPALHGVFSVKVGWALCFSCTRFFAVGGLQLSRRQVSESAGNKAAKRQAMSEGS